MENSQKHSTESAYPLLPGARLWKPRDLMMVSISTAIATWCLLEGGFVGTYLNAKMGMASFVAGAMIGMLLLALSTITITTKYGIDSVTSSKPLFGNKGWIIGLVLSYISIIGWNCTILIFFAKALNKLLVQVGVMPESFSAAGTSIFSVIAVVAIWFILRKGSTAVMKASTIISIVVVLVGIWMFYMIISKFGFQAIWDAKPASPSPDLLYNYAVGIEVGLIAVVAWWPYIGGIVRLVPKARNATWPAMFGLGLPVPLMGIVGLFSILLIGDSDPTGWMVELGGLAFGSIALGFIAFANFGSAVVGVYTSCLGLRNVEYFQKMSWNKVTTIAILPIALIAILIPDLFFNNFGSFLTILGVLFAPLVGIQLVDHFVLRKKELDVRALFDSSLNSKYAFYKGWNPASLIAMGAGFLTYLSLLDPITFEAAPLYKYMTATLPTIFVGGLVYWLASIAIVIPKGWGGYTAEPQRNPSKDKTAEQFI